MKQFTTEWAKGILRHNNNLICVYQDSDLKVKAIYCQIKTKDTMEKNREYFANGTIILHDDFLEHHNGWENSKVTREEL